MSGGSDVICVAMYSTVLSLSWFRPIYEYQAEFRSLCNIDSSQSGQAGTVALMYKGTCSNNCKW